MSRKIRPIRIEGNIAYVPLTRGYEAIIDLVDAPLVDQWNWTAVVRFRKDGSIRTVYAMRTRRDADGKQRCLRMHGVIAGTPNGLDTDHVDGNGLNNRRGNLRIATRSQNMQNGRIRFNSSSGIKGVYWHKWNRKWAARINADGEDVHLGYHATRDDAAAAYAEASAKLHGAFGRVA